jgi:hypothetical protein
VSQLILLLALLFLVACGGPRGGTSAPAATTTTAADKLLSAKELLAKFQQDGLPVGQVTCFTEESDPNDMLGRPGGYTSKCDWADKREQQSDPEDLTGGSIEVFDASETAIARADALSAFAGAGMLSTGYTWVVGSATVLRIDKELTSKQAAEYRTAALEVLG